MSTGDHSSLSGMRPNLALLSGGKNLGEENHPSTVAQNHIPQPQAAPEDTHPNYSASYPGTDCSQGCPSLGLSEAPCYSQAQLTEPTSSVPQPPLVPTVGGTVPTSPALPAGEALSRLHHALLWFAHGFCTTLLPSRLLNRCLHFGRHSSLCLGFLISKTGFKNTHSNMLKQCDKEHNNVGKAPGTIQRSVKITFPSLASPKGFNDISKTPETLHRVT